MGMGKKQVVSIPLGALPLRSGKALQVGGQQIALFRLGSGEVRALENRSPRRGGPLAEGMVAGEYVFCPLYDWKISLTDGRVQAPDTGRVRTYPTEVRGDQVTVVVE